LMLHQKVQSIVVRHPLGQPIQEHGARASRAEIYPEALAKLRFARAVFRIQNSGFRMNSH
jgi:hypothetical protein